MGTEHYYANIKTKEYIELGKAPMWTDMYSDLVHGEIDTSLIHTYLNETLGRYSTNKDYITWVADNVFTFIVNANDNLIFIMEDLAYVKTNDAIDIGDLNPPFYIHQDNCPWKLVWDRYIRNNSEMNTKNLFTLKLNGTPI